MGGTLRFPMLKPDPAPGDRAKDNRAFLLAGVA